MPTARDCAVFQVLFKRTFEELWPLCHLKAQANAVKAKAIIRNLAIIVDRLPEDFTNLI
jgi:hypothetical protein